MSTEMNDVNILKYKKLDEIEHVLLRPGRYIGSITPVTMLTWFINDNGEIEERELTYSPAFHKLFDEVISNSADHSKTPEGKDLNIIRVIADPISETITVYDNGGIPVVKHPEYDQYIPEMIFGELRSGSNFDNNEDSLATGQNGEGASLTNIFSLEFNVTTTLNSTKFYQQYKNNLSERSEPIISHEPFKGARGTTIQYSPDLKRLNASFDEDNLLLLKRRCYEIAFTNPHLTVYYNDKEIKIKSFDEFIKLYDPNAITLTTEHWNIGISLSKTGFKHISFVNSTPSFDGGTHVDYVSNKIVDEVREYIEKKTKVAYRPADIKNNFKFFIDCKIHNPRYNSQTKEKLITPVNQYGTQLKFTDRFIKNLLRSKMITEIIESAKRKQELEDAKKVAEEAKDIRRSGLYDIPNYRPATSKKRSDCILFLTEGDSALKPLKATSDPKIHGLFPLRGKPQNCFESGVKEVFSREILYIMTILNLKLGQTDFSDLKYDKIAIATDSDLDGNHIKGLLVLFFSKFFPELMKNGRVQFFYTPVVTAVYKGKEHFFNTEEEFHEFSKDKEKIKAKYCKGLGSHSSDNMRKFLANPDNFITIEYDPVVDHEILELVFSPEKSDERKEWVDLK